MIWDDTEDENMNPKNKFYSSQIYEILKCYSRQSHRMPVCGHQGKANSDAGHQQL